MATVTDTTGLALGNIPLSTVMVDKDATVTLISGASDTILENVSGLISSAVSTAWKAGGSKAPTDLTSALLVAANEGKVYNMSASGTTDTNFVEGSGVPYLAGTDIAVIDVGTGGTHTYKFNVLAATDSSVVKSIYLGNSMGTPLTPTNGAVTIPISDSTTKSDGLISYEDWKKLSGIASGAEVNQNAFSKIAVSGVTGTGDAASKTDTLTLVPGTNVTMSRSGKSVTINASQPSVPVTGAQINGADLTITDKKIQIPEASCGTAGVVKIATNISGAVDTQVPTFGLVSNYFVSGGTLHTNLVSKGLLNPSSSSNNTIYGLIAAIHASDTSTEST